MKRFSRPTARPPRPRRGFTLIELLMVIVIIAALIALLLPAISSVRERFRISEVRNEISQLEAAIADFKLKFGQEPPSQIVIYERWDDGSGGGPGWAVDSRARATIRKLWPKFDFGQRTGLVRDINNNGNGTDVYTLKGDQCLVFFLGGGYNNGQFIGFSGDPTQPFKVSSSSATTRIGPFFDFDMGRVVDNDSVIPGYGAASLQMFPVYLDPYPEQTKPYLYATSYDGLGYNNADLNTPGTAATSGFLPYTTSTAANAPPWKPNKFQIISAGPDTVYGPGGPYMPDANDKLPDEDLNNNDTLDPGEDRNGNGVIDKRLSERDNITNLASGKLAF